MNKINSFLLFLVAFHSAAWGTLRTKPYPPLLPKFEKSLIKRGFVVGSSSGHRISQGAGGADILYRRSGSSFTEKIKITIHKFPEPFDSKRYLENISLYYKPSKFKIPFCHSEGLYFDREYSILRLVTRNSVILVQVAKFHSVADKYHEFTIHSESEATKILKSYGMAISRESLALVQSFDNQKEKT
jgi:hypothetical protein